LPNIPQSGPYDTAEYILNLTRAYINDMTQSQAGNVLNDSQPYTFIYLNGGYRYIQKKLWNSGIRSPIKEQILLNVTPVPATALDPATQVFIDYSEYFDGLNQNATPVLPTDMLMPQRIWERQHGTLQNYVPMVQAQDGLPSRSQTICLGVWEWRGDKIWMTGATQANDLRLRYQAFFPDVAKSSDLILLTRCENALAWATAWEFAKARGGAFADSCKQNADDELKEIRNENSRQQQRKNIRRVPYSRRGSGGPGWW